MDNQMLKKKLDIKFCLLEHRTAGQRFLWARQRSHMFPIGQSDESRGGRMAEKRKVLRKNRTCDLQNQR